LRGDSKIVLNGPDKIVLTESMAVKYFGSEDPVGKSITIIAGNSKREMEISGIVEDKPCNSHLKFDFITPALVLWELLNWITIYIKV
jgi:putative ABC transport system permease protein